MSSTSARIHLDVHRATAFEILVDGVPVVAHPGESVAAAMLAAALRTSRHSPRRGEPRGYFCGMGVCWECAVRIDDDRLERACMVPARAGMRIDTGGGGCA